MPSIVLKKSHSLTAVDSAMGSMFKGRKSRQSFSELAQGLRAGMMGNRASNHQLVWSVQWCHFALPKEPAASGGGVIEQMYD